MRKLLAALLVLVLAVQAFAAATTSTGLDCAGLPRIVLTVNGATTGDVVCTDTGTLHGKRAQVVRFVTNGETKFVLHRVQRANNGLFIDSIAAETTTALAARILAFDLTSTALGHPSPVNDAADDECATLMIGYTGA